MKEELDELIKNKAVTIKDYSVNLILLRIHKNRKKPRNILMQKSLKLYGIKKFDSPKR